VKPLLLAGAALAGVAVVVVVVLLVHRGKGNERAATAVTTAQTKGPVRPPPPSAFVLAREEGSNAVALAAEPQALRVTVLAPSGSGASGLPVTIDGKPTAACGPGCYLLRGSHGSRVVVGVGKRRLPFVVPRSTPAAGGIVARASRAFRRLRSVSYVERLASSPSNHIVSTFVLEAPDRLHYRIHGGSTATVIGTRRWDGCTRSTTSVLQQPTPVWGLGPVANAHVIRRRGSVLVVSFVVPGVPAWFEVSLDPRTLLPRTVEMTATAHFMRHTYYGFNAPRRIFPPKC
jgi:hypothetical protein